MAGLPISLLGQVDAYELGVLWLLETYRHEAKPLLRQLAHLAGVSEQRLDQLLERLRSRGLLPLSIDPSHW